MSASTIRDKRYTVRRVPLSDPPAYRAHYNGRDLGTFPTRLLAEIACVQHRDVRSVSIAKKHAAQIARDVFEKSNEPNKIELTERNFAEWLAHAATVAIREV